MFTDGRPKLKNALVVVVVGYLSFLETDGCDLVVTVVKIRGAQEVIK